MIFPNGTESQTTFWEDFSIADKFGVGAVKDTYRRAFKMWKSDYIFLTELVIVLNLKCWDWYERGNTGLSKLYSDLFYKAQNYAWDTLKGEEADYFFEMTD